MIQIPIEIGDTILAGRFRNKRIIVKSIGKDEHGSPTVNGRSILNCRIEKLMKPKTAIKESETAYKYGDAYKFINSKISPELKKKFKNAALDIVKVIQKDANADEISANEMLQYLKDLLKPV